MISDARGKPISYKDPMVCGLILGNKNQTRRPMDPQPSADWLPHSYGEVHKMRDGQFVMRKGAPVVVGWGASNEDGDEAYVCPYGGPECLLWVREAHRFVDGDCVEYRADEARIAAPHSLNLSSAWRPPMFTFRWASRITLKMIRIRAERLLDISEEDAAAEGPIPQPNHPGRWLSTVNDATSYPTAKAAFLGLWEWIYGAESIAANPWLWAIHFSYLYKNIDRIIHEQ